MWSGSMRRYAPRRRQTVHNMRLCHRARSRLTLVRCLSPLSPIIAGFDALFSKLSICPGRLNTLTTRRSVVSPCPLQHWRVAGPRPTARAGRAGDCVAQVVRFEVKRNRRKRIVCSFCVQRSLPFGLLHAPECLGRRRRQHLPSLEGVGCAEEEEHR